MLWSSRGDEVFCLSDSLFMAFGFASIFNVFLGAVLELSKGNLFLLFLIVFDKFPRSVVILQPGERALGLPRVSLTKVVRQLVSRQAGNRTGVLLQDSALRQRRGELEEVLKLVQPQHFLPVHGEYAFLCAHAEMARDLGMSSTHVIRNGQMLGLAERRNNATVSQSGILGEAALHLFYNDGNKVSPPPASAVSCLCSSFTTFGSVMRALVGTFLALASSDS